MKTQKIILHLWKLAGLPDGIFSDQKITIWVNVLGPWNFQMVYFQTKNPNLGIF
jgi:hypothetical protein